LFSLSEADNARARQSMPESPMLSEAVRPDRWHRASVDLPIAFAPLGLRKTHPVQEWSRPHGTSVARVGARPDRPGIRVHLESSGP